MVRVGITERACRQTAGHKTRCVFDRSHIVSDENLEEAAGRLDRVFSPQTMTTRFDVNPRISNLWVALYPNHQQFIFHPVSDYPGLNSLFGETAGVSCMPAVDRMPVG